MAAILVSLGFTFLIDRMTEVLTPDIYIELTAACFCNMSLPKLCVFLFVNCIFIFRLANTVCHEIFGNFIRHSEIFGLPPPPPTIHASYGPVCRVRHFSVLSFRARIRLFRLARGQT